MANHINYTEDSGFPSVISWPAMDYIEIMQWGQKSSPRSFWNVGNVFEGRGAVSEGGGSLAFGADSVSPVKDSASSLLEAERNSLSSPHNSVRAQNSLSSVFETVLSETVFGP